MRSFQKHVGEFEHRGIRLVAISVDPVETNLRHSRRMGYTFTFLADPPAEVIRHYDLLHPKAGPGGADIARPGEFLLDSTGTVRWMNLTENLAVRARPEQALQAADEMLSASR